MMRSAYTGSVANILPAHLLRFRLLPQEIAHGGYLSLQRLLAASRERQYPHVSIRSGLMRTIGESLKDCVGISTCQCQCRHSRKLERLSTGEAWLLLWHNAQFGKRNLWIRSLQMKRGR